jgi:DNA mismatch repair protein MutS
MGYAAIKHDLSPMMTRYVEYKERYPDALLFFQVGDFYEVFFDDAVTVARSLNLTLTSRDKNNPNPIHMCGVPLAVIDSYVDRLVLLGFSVAVVSQTGSGQGVERALERFVTPGMRLFNSVNSDTTECLVAAVALDGDGKTACVASIDPQAGVLRIRESVDLGAIGAEISNVMAKEIVLPKTALGEKLDRRTSWIKAIEGRVGENLLRFRAEPTAIEGASTFEPRARAEFHALSPGAKRAARLLLSYVEEISLGNMVPVREVTLTADSGRLIIDAATRRNLELVQNTKDGTRTGTLFEFLDCAATPGGSRMLRQWLLSPLCDRYAIEQRLEAVNELLLKYGKVRESLSGLSDLERLAARIQLTISSPRDLVAAREILRRIPVIKEIVVAGGPGLLSTLSARLEVPSDPAVLLERALSESPPHQLQDGGVIRDGYDTELDSIRAARANADAWRADFEAREREASGIQSLKVKVNNVIGYFIEVGTAHSARIPSHYKRRQSTANAERFTTPELEQHEDLVVTAVDRQVRREQHLFNEVKSALHAHVEAFRIIAGALSELDVLAALASTAERNGWVAPELVPAPVLEIERGKHPIVESLLDGRFIPNSIHFSTGGASCYVLTGPNMGGKSTYLRQSAIIAVLTHMGSFVPADSARVGLVDRIFARLGAADDLHEGESTFMVEMREAAHIIANATERSLVLIDELGRGTATSDGLSLAQAILEQLVHKIGCRTLFATHYHELTTLAQVGGPIENLSVGSVEEEDRVVFTHEIQAGPAPRSYGIEVAKLSGLPSEIIGRAAELLASSEERKAASSGVRQFGLFEASPAPAPVPVPAKIDPKLKQLQEKVRAIKPDELSPRDALALMYELKTLVIP